MKNKSKLLLLGALPLVAGAAPLIASCSCEGGPKTVWGQKKFALDVNSNMSVYPYKYDTSRSYGGFIHNGNHHLSGQFFKNFPENETKILTEKVTENGIPKTNLYVQTPTFTSLKFDLINKVVITLKDGTVKVYDNDEAEIKPEADGKVVNGVKTYLRSTYTKTSNNAKSINNISFKKDLKNASKLQMLVREDVHYTDNKGNKTKYTVQPKDFYYSFLRTYALNAEYRHANGGSEELDNFFRQSNYADANTTIFGKTEHFTGTYLYEVFGINWKNFLKENEFIKDVEANSGLTGKALTFETEDAENASFDSFFDYTLDIYTFMPAPSQYIDELNASEKQVIRNYLGQEVSQEDEKKALDKINSMDKESIAYKIGVYWYGYSEASTLYSGNYYKAKDIDQSIVFKKNKNYWDTNWVNDKNTIEELIWNYKVTKQDENQFNRTAFNLYKQGTLSIISYSQLSEEEKKEVLNKQQAFGLRYNQRKNANTPYYKMITLPYVTKMPKKDDGTPIASIDDFYGFNDAYAKMMWGAKRAELAEHGGDGETFISGTGLSFRTLINAAVNWDKFSILQTGGTGSAWLAKVADGSDIGGSDQNTSQYKTPSDVAEEINSLYAIDKDGNKVDFGAELGTELSFSENEKAASKFANIDEQLKSAGFEIVKEKLADLIAKFDNDNPDLAGQPFKFRYFCPYGNMPESFKNAFKAIKELFKKLNPRLDIAVQNYPNPNVEQWNWYAYYQANGANYISWGYDYNSIGSGYDGLSWSGQFIPMLTQVKHIAETNDKFANNFPELVDLAKSAVEYEKTHRFVASVPFENFYKIADGDRATITFESDVLSYEYELGEDGKYHKVLLNGKPKKFEDPNATDNYAWSAKFWNYYVRSKTNDFLIKLMSNITSFMNYNFGFGTNRGRDTYSKVLVNSHYVVPSIQGQQYDIYANWKIKP